MPTTKNLILIILLLGTLSCLCLAYAYFIEPNRLIVARYDIYLDDWDPAFEGIRFALISDIHGGSNGASEENIRRVVSTTNELNVDAVFLLGDYLSRDPADHSKLRMQPSVIAENLRGLRSKYGVFAVLGNHDEAYGAETIAKELDRVGYNVLNGKLADIRLQTGERLRLIGLKDHTNIGVWKYYSDNARNMLSPDDGTGNLIALQHSPDALPAITGEYLISKDLKILFAGHTHGGQVWLPILKEPVVPSFYGQRVARGLIKINDLDVFITPGIGTSILPFRFLVPPEISVVTIRSKRS